MVDDVASTIAQQAEGAQAPMTAEGGASAAAEVPEAVPAESPEAAPPTSPDASGDAATQPSEESAARDEHVEHRPPRIEVSVSLTEDDVIAFNRAWGRASGERARAIWGARAWALAPVAGGVAIIVLGDRLLGGALIALGVVLALAAGPFYDANVRRSIGRQLVGRGSSVLGTRRIIIDKNGVYDGGRFERQQVAWAGVIELVASSEALYIFIGAMQAIIVPARAFASPFQFERAVAVAERFSEQRARRV